MDVFAVCFPLWFQVFHLLSAMSLPLRLIHCCLDTRPLKVIKKSLSSCVQSLCLRKQFSGNGTRKITLLVQTLSVIREGDAVDHPQSWRSWPFLCGGLFCSQTHPALGDSTGQVVAWGPAGPVGLPPWAWALTGLAATSQLSRGTHDRRASFWQVWGSWATAGPASQTTIQEREAGLG